MVLAINNTKTLADLQEKFNECFPHLQLEFYTHPHHWQEPSEESERLHPATNVADLNLKNENGLLAIKSSYQIGRVEQDFQKQFGLNVQIFRKENDTWVQTSKTDSLLLKEQPATNKPVSVSHQDGQQLEESFLQGE